jgi:hypothetical protein
MYPRRKLDPGDPPPLLLLLPLPWSPFAVAISVLLTTSNLKTLRRGSELKRSSSLSRLITVLEISSWIRCQQLWIWERWSCAGEGIEAGLKADEDEVEDEDGCDKTAPVERGRGTDGRQYRFETSKLLIQRPYF